jgi:hypothetical protein
MRPFQPDDFQRLPVKKLNLYEMYTFGKQLAALSGITQAAKINAHIFQLWFARENLRALIKDESPLLSTSRRAARKMIETIDRVLPQDLAGIAKIADDSAFEWAANSITNAMSELESVLGNDMPDIAAYVVSQKGIYRTEDLIDHADYQLTADIRATLPPQATSDLREAGKCLAYELATACTFHLWRAIETVMESYYAELAAKTFDQANVTRNSGAHIKALGEAGADSKITAFLDHMRDEYRNPQTHPDAVIEIDEAQRLFAVAISSIDQMMVAIRKHNKAHLPAIANIFASGAGIPSNK